MSNRFTLILLMILFCIESNGQNLKSFLALGDGYTCGEGVEFVNNWPSQLVALFNQEEIQFKQPKLIAKAGWKTDNVLEKISSVDQKKYNLIGIQIGLNDQNLNQDIKVFKRNLGKIIEQSIEIGKNGNNSIFILSIPDYSYSPKGHANKKKITTDIEAMNNICKELASKYEILYIDINEDYKLTRTNGMYLAKNKIHPSEKMFELWVKTIYSKINESKKLSY